MRALLTDLVAEDVRYQAAESTCGIEDGNAKWIRHVSQIFDLDGYNDARVESNIGVHALVDCIHSNHKRWHIDTCGAETVT